MAKAKESDSPKKPKLVPMVRNDDNKAADVHPDEVERYQKAGWRKKE